MDHIILRFLQKTFSSEKFQLPKEPLDKGSNTSLIKIKDWMKSGCYIRSEVKDAIKLMERILLKLLDVNIFISLIAVE
ncbi:unnamed protein product [Rhizophagus irregularis]|nr:unnamed protein product [Rhizophagus irregularis]CAB4413238.1 unnamed protein product [Rhizophagus irregularis]